MGESSSLNAGEELVDLPPGFRFHPTDEEIIIHYLIEKVTNNFFSCVAIAEADLNKSEPWDLPQKAKLGEKEWFFFCQRDRKYPTGTRTNRATQSGYWKATGKDKEIHKDKEFLVGMKKTLVFYKGRAPRGEKTEWVMNEYRLEGRLSQFNIPKSTKDEWVVCRVYNKGATQKRNPFDDPSILRINSIEQDIDNLLDYSSLPPLNSPSYNICQTTPDKELKPEYHLNRSSFQQTSHNQLYPMNPLLYTKPDLSYMEQVPNTVLGVTNTIAAMPNQNSKQKNVLSYNRSFDDMPDLENLWSF